MEFGKELLLPLLLLLLFEWSMPEKTGPKPSSLIQKRADHIRLMRYGSQTNQTIKTNAPRAQTMMFRKRYFVMWLTKT